MRQVTASFTVVKICVIIVMGFYLKKIKYPQNNTFTIGKQKQKNCNRLQLSLSFWQGRQDSNLQPTVLETATLPLSHSPKNLVNIN